MRACAFNRVPMYAYVRVHMHACVSVSMCVCVCMRVSVGICTRYACMACLQLHTHTCVRVCICAYVHVHIRASVCPCACAHIPARVYFCVHACGIKEGYKTEEGGRQSETRAFIQNSPYHRFGKLLKTSITDLVQYMMHCKYWAAHQHHHPIHLRLDNHEIPTQHSMSAPHKTRPI